jgi:hypothetical protein
MTFGTHPVFRPKLDKVTGVWRKLHFEEFKEPYCLPNVIWFVMWRRWGGGVLGRGAYRMWWGNLRERVYLEDAGIDGRLTLN